MMMSCLCSHSSITSPAPTIASERPQFDRSDSSLNGTTGACCISNFTNGCSSDLLRRVSSSNRLASGPALDSFWSSSSRAPVESNVICAKSAAATESGSEREANGTVGDLEAVTVDELASSLNLAAGVSINHRRPPVALVVDCRGFVSFNVNHILSAFNASCGDRFARKRLTDGKVTVADLVSCGPETEVSGCNARDRYRRLVKMAVAEGLSIVAYDDNTSDMESLPVTHPLRFITGFLKKTGAAVKFLIGGLQAFHASYPLLCSKPHEPPSRPMLYSPTTPVVEMDVDSAELSEVLPFLFIGNERDAASRTVLEKNGINHVLNVTSHVPLHFECDDNMNSRRLPATDNGRQNLKQYFENAIEFIESARCTGGRVIVHCQAGVSRSPTIVLAYMMARYNLSMMSAFNYVKSRRSVIAPNFNFMGQLMEFEQRCAAGELRHCLREDVPLVPASIEPSAQSLE